MTIFQQHTIRDTGLNRQRRVDSRLPVCFIAAAALALFSTGCFGPDSPDGRRPIEELTNDNAGRTMLVNLRLATGY